MKIPLKLQIKFVEKKGLNLLFKIQNIFEFLKYSVIVME